MTVKRLLEHAELPSMNRLTVRAACTETWKALNMQDYSGGPLTPLGNLLSGRKCVGMATRGRSMGLLQPPMRRAASCLAWRAYTLWNNYPQLRVAKDLEEAKKVAEEISFTVPL